MFTEKDIITYWVVTVRKKKKSLLKLPKFYLIIINIVNAFHFTENQMLLEIIIYPSACGNYSFYHPNLGNHPIIRIFWHPRFY